jgi:RimJ/RimL family protein N-acetyltransferase
VSLPELRTSRLLLRDWRESDRKPFAALNADPDVMEHFPAVLTAEESDAMVDRILTHISARGFGLWAVEIPEVTQFAGFIGLAVPAFDVPFAPAVEIGWRLARDYWGKGYATEGARAVLSFGFESLGLSDIVSYTVPANKRSIAVMLRLGMSYRGEFDHPRLALGSPLRRHVWYGVPGN